MPTVGSSESGFELNGEWIALRGDELRNSEGVLAGSNLTMDVAVRNAQSFTGVSWDEAARMASQYPATVIGHQQEIGSISPGARADLVELSEDDSIYRVWRSGRVVAGAEL
jgi:N-acetylglucosamine-6-phosphate deacetylase